MSADPFQSWKEEYKWENCQLGNKEYGMFLSNYIKSQKKALTLNINGQWGIGKTHFLRQIYTQLRYKEELPTIYINAWESDFSNDPLLVIVSEILNQVKLVSTKQNMKAHLDNALSKLKKFYNGSLKLMGATASIASGQAIYYTIGKDMQLEETKEQEDLSSLYFEQQQALKDLRKVLKDVVLATPEKQVFVLVDELDRCRPNYAVEFLETIKHIFDIDGLVFVVATDTEQLSHSIKAIYGATFDGSEYLSRFFERTAKIPAPDKQKFSEYLINNSSVLESKLDLLFLPYRGKSEQKDAHLASIFSVIGEVYDLSLRRILQLFEKYESIVAALPENRYFDSHLMIQLLCEFSIHLSNQYDLKKNRELVITHNKLDQAIQSDNYIFDQAAMSNYKISSQTLNQFQFSYALMAYTGKLAKSDSEFTHKFRVNLSEFSIEPEESDENRYYEYVEHLLDFHAYRTEKAEFLPFRAYFNYVELAKNIN